MAQSMRVDSRAALSAKASLGLGDDRQRAGIMEDKACDEQAGSDERHGFDIGFVHGWRGGGEQTFTCTATPETI
jgi:hypothetical protein